MFATSLVLVCQHGCELTLYGELFDVGWTVISAREVSSILLYNLLDCEILRDRNGSRRSVANGFVAIFMTESPFPRYEGKIRFGTLERTLIHEVLGYAGVRVRNSRLFSQMAFLLPSMPIHRR